METVKEKIAYLRGMLDGSDSIKEEQNRIILQHILEVLDELADDVDELYYGQEELDEYIEAVDLDLADLEDEDCCNHHHSTDDGDGMVEMECPTCQEMVCFDENFLFDDDVEVTCPECGETLFSSGDLDNSLVEFDDIEE